MIEEIGLPPGVVSVPPGDGTVGELLVSHGGVDKVSFTGSTAAGRAGAAACAPNLTRVSLELGGKSAAIVLDGATPEAVTTSVRSASLSNGGQICNALTRALLIPPLTFAQLLVATSDSVVLGANSTMSTSTGRSSKCTSP
jgi:acyl-CoA reductase-like NAD-dependent aldehyde dehydrogenase